MYYFQEISDYVGSSSAKSELILKINCRPLSDKFSRKQTTENLRCNWLLSVQSKDMRDKEGTWERHETDWATSWDTIVSKKFPPVHSSVNSNIN